MNSQKKIPDALGRFHVHPHPLYPDIQHIQLVYSQTFFYTPQAINDEVLNSFQSFVWVHLYTTVFRP